MMGIGMAVRPPRSRGPVLMMIDALRRLGGSLWMVDNAFSGSFVGNVGTTPVTAVGDLIGKVLDKTGTNHATQSAVASKPSVQRVPKRLGPNLVSNGDFSAGTAGWSANNGGAISVSGGELTVTNSIASSGRGYQLVPTEVGKPYLITSFARAGTASAIVGWGTLAGSSGGGSVLTSSAHPLQLDFVATAASTSVTLQTNTATAGHTASFDNIEVREVLEWANVISFDGSNDFLQTGITTGNEGWVCAGVTSNSYAVTKTIFWTGANGPSEAGATLRVLGGGVVQMVTCDGTAQAASSGGANAATGTPQVIDGGWNATTLRAAVDGAEATAPNTRGGASTQTAKIGDAASGQWFNGPMHAIAYTPVLPDAATRKIIRNGIAALQGRTL